MSVMHKAGSIKVWGAQLPQKRIQSGTGMVDLPIWVFPKIGVPQNRWLIMENPIKMDDLGVPLFLETSIYLPIFG